MVPAAQHPLYLSRAPQMLRAFICSPQTPTLRGGKQGQVHKRSPCHPTKPPSQGSLPSTPMAAQPRPSRPAPSSRHQTFGAPRRSQQFPCLGSKLGSDISEPALTEQPRGPERLPLLLHGPSSSGAAAGAGRADPAHTASRCWALGSDGVLATPEAVAGGLQLPLLNASSQTENLKGQTHCAVARKLPGSEGTGGGPARVPPGPGKSCRKPA